MRALAALLSLSLAAPAIGCTTIVVSVAAGAVSGAGGSLATDDDPELVRDAIPPLLKTIEALLDADPDNEDLLLAACASFTQYAYAFVQQEAERLDEKDPPRSRELFARARKLYARAKRYGMRGLEALEEGFVAAFDRDRKAAVRLFEDEEDDVPLLYWTGLSWAALISVSKNDATLLGEQPRMETLMARAFELDEAWGEGAIHEFYIAYEGAEKPDSARRHFERAIELSRGKKVSPWLSLAESVEQPRQDRKRFLQLLDQVIAFNVDEAPEHRLVNLIMQERARRLKARVDDLFAE